MNAKRPVPGVEPLFYGVWTSREAGHYLYAASGRSFSIWDVPPGVPPKPHLDGGYCPPDDGRQVEGRAALTYLLHPGGVGAGTAWTVLSFWDRSGDKRNGSHSTFLLPRARSFSEAVAEAKLAFPTVFARYTFEIVLGNGDAC